MKNIAIIPARSGSKGVQDKNIKLLNGKPLLAYTIEAAKKSEIFSEIFVSTDSENYAILARNLGASVPFLRSSEESTDIASPWGMIQEALANYKTIGKEFDTFCKLQPTSPLRTGEHIKTAYELLSSTNANSIISVCEMEHTPLWSNTLPTDLCMEGFLAEKNEKPRQILETYYRLNGAIFISKIPYFHEYENIYKKKAYAYIMDNYSSIDIDTELDFLVAEVIQKYLNEQ